MKEHEILTPEKISPENLKKTLDLKTRQGWNIIFIQPISDFDMYNRADFYIILQREKIKSKPNI